MSMMDLIKSRGVQRFPDMEIVMIDAMKKVIKAVPALSGVQVSTMRNTDFGTNLVLEYNTGESVDFVRYDTATLTLYTTEGYKYANQTAIAFCDASEMILDYSSGISVIDVIDLKREPKPNEGTDIRTIELDLTVKAR